MIITLDIPKEHLDGMRELITKHQIEVRDYQAKGPAGGNPRFTLATDRKAAAKALVEFYFGE